LIDDNPEGIMGDQPENREFTEAEKARGEHVRDEDVDVPASVATGRDNPRRGPQQYDPSEVHPSQLHGATHRNRQDEDLGPGDMVEMTIRHGPPLNGWLDCPHDDGLEGVLAALAHAGAEGKGINLIAAFAERVDQMVLRELQAGKVPARLVRRRGG
jgi:hypothetical protein